MANSLDSNLVPRPLCALIAHAQRAKGSGRFPISYPNGFCQSPSFSSSMRSKKLEGSGYEIVWILTVTCELNGNCLRMFTCLRQKMSSNSNSCIRCRELTSRLASLAARFRVAGTPACRLKEAPRDGCFRRFSKHLLLAGRRSP